MGKRPKKRSPHPARVTETYALRDLIEGAIARFNGLSCGCNAHLFHRLCGSNPHLPEEGSREVAGTHCGVLRELVDRQRLCKVCADPCDQGLESPRLSTKFE